MSIYDNLLQGLPLHNQEPVVGGICGTFRHSEGIVQIMLRSASDHQRYELRLDDLNRGQLEAVLHALKFHEELIHGPEFNAPPDR